jgi:hypothetical protein
MIIYYSFYGVGASSFIKYLWFESFERSMFPQENKGGEDAKGPWHDETKLELGMTRGPHVVKGFILEIFELVGLWE